MSKTERYIKGRGAQINPANRFHSLHVEESGFDQNDQEYRESLSRSEYIPVHPKTILNKVDSPDIGMSYSMNPYQGCEHGCVYCYARNSHAFWDYSPGIDFERKILIKKEAPKLLEEKLKSPKWKPLPIMFSGNTDCYQPAEKKYELTRQMLEVLLKYRHPVGIITKASLLLRDVDVLKELAKYNLVHVNISITTLNEELRQKLEPRTATGDKRLHIVSKLISSNIPTSVMMGPVIPSLNDGEIMDIARKSAEAGALAFNYIVVRLNGEVGNIFKDWLVKNFPDRSNRVLHQIENLHGGQLNDSRFGVRMKGEGNFADMIRQQYYVAKKKYFQDRVMPPYDMSLYEKAKTKQLSLF